ncbi:MAG: saccharopine dehydrogenase family protein [Halobacteriales archaeon]
MDVHINGAGLMGGAIGYDLSNHGASRIVFVDANSETLQTAEEFVGTDTTETAQVDISDRSEYVSFLEAETPDVVINALPHELSVPALEGIIEAGIDAIDLAFEEEQWELADAADAQDATMITGCGVAPGISNMLAGDGVVQLDDPTDITIKVGGIPAEPKPPLEYRVVFHLNSVWNAYTRPATIVEGGERVDVPALSGVERIEFDDVGELECFYTDGLGTLPYTFEEVPNMAEKTIRYPGHALKAKTLRECGLLDEDPIDINGSAISPREFLTELLTPELYLGDDHDLTVLQVDVASDSRNPDEQYQATMIDRYDDELGMTSMARTTGFTASIVAQRLVDGAIDDSGLIAPETLAENRSLFEDILTALERRDIEIDRSVTG